MRTSANVWMSAGQHAPVLPARPRREPRRDLALDHDDGARKSGAQIEEPKEDRRRHVVRQVRDDRRVRGVEHLVERQLEHVPRDDLHVRPVGVALDEPGSEAAVDLHEPEAPRALGERVRERARAGTDLEHGRLVADGGEVDDPADDVRIDEEVLAEALAGSELRRGERLTRFPPRAHHAVASNGTPNGSDATASRPSPSSSPREAAPSGERDHRRVVGAERGPRHEHLDAALGAHRRHALAEAAVRGDAARHDEPLRAGLVERLDRRVDQHVDERLPARSRRRRAARARSGDCPVPTARRRS
jgi:hypothetical protein